MKKLKEITLAFFIVGILLSIVVPFLFDLNWHKAIAAESVTKHNHQASIAITNPQTQNQLVFSHFFIINGTVSSNTDAGSATVKKVEAYVSKIPFNATGKYRLAAPITPGNWSRWSFPIVLNKTGSYLVRARVTDNTGDQNWADVTIHLPAQIYNKRIAFVEPVFTYAAYRNGSFYNFYKKYSLSDVSNKIITTDLNLLKNRPIPHGPFQSIQYYAHSSKAPNIPYIDYFNILLQHVKNNSPFVTRMTDIDVHQGKIFQTNGSNAYDVLFLFHNEYATQSEYNNLKQFVSNGGIIVFTEGNTLFAEVSYNKANDSITLLNGHYWNLNGKGATPSIGERWLNENKEWTGSNFFDVPSSIKVYFKNNPFNYTHSEEQYVTNPKAKILINYQASYSSRKYPNPTIATYYINYKKGKVIDLGIWGHTLTDNKSFLNYFDNVIMPLALGPPVSVAQYLQKVSSNADNIRYNKATPYLHPVITLPPMVVAATGPSGAVVSYPVPSAMNNNNTSSQSSLVCSPPSGSVFPIGNTIVRCTATNSNNNNSTATFTVQVIEMTSH